MTKFYNYDTRGASTASQIINLERMVQERDAEIERLRSLVEAKDLLLSEWLGEEKAQSEIERLHELLEVCMARWIPFAEVEFRRRVKEALRYE